MKMRKVLALSIGLIIGISGFGQEVELNWKISPDETLSYQTIMHEIDTSTAEFNFGGLFEAFSDSSREKTAETKSLFKELNESFKSIDLLTYLTNSGKGTVEIVMKIRPEEAPEKSEADTTENEIAEMMKMMQSMNQGTMLRGSVYETGGIHSFWVKNNQRNLIALFFQLPAKPVKVGDSWELDVNLIANDQNFECESASKVNKVTVTDLRKANGETIAVLKYEIEEFVDGTFHAPAMFGNGGPTKTMMKFTYQAIAEFSVDRGRWVSYDGIMGFTSNGVMTAKSKKKFSLIAE
ncbi:MAG: hypothetical protein Roseis2KO_17190 [Roseivirga sp.]